MTVDLLESDLQPQQCRRQLLLIREEVLADKRRQISVGRTPQRCYLPHASLDARTLGFAMLFHKLSDECGVWFSGSR